MKKPIIVVAFDVEARGRSPSRNGLLAVGLVAKRIDELGLASPLPGLERLWKIGRLRPEQTFEPRCMDEFWSKRLDLLAELETDPIPPGQFAYEFRALLDSLEQMCRVYLVCDNPAFDAAFVDHYLDASGFPPMQYSADGRTYRPIHDSDSYTRGAVGLAFEHPNAKDDRVADEIGMNLPSFSGTKHNPLDDARYIWAVHYMVVKSRPGPEDLNGWE